MTKTLFIFDQGAIAGQQENILAQNVVHALRLLQNAGFDCIKINTGTTKTDNAAGQVERLLASQAIVFEDSVQCADDSAAVVAGELAPVFAKSTFSLEESLIVFNSEAVNKQNVEHLAQRLGLACADLAIIPSSGAVSGAVNRAVTGAGWLPLADSLANRNRTASSRRRTNETDILVELNLDSADKTINVETGLGFFDHMLEQLAKHGGFAMNVRCDGDLHIDEHHTVEDCALAIGQTLREALGDKRGIGRYGFLLPMDETEVQVSMDLSARPSFHFKGQFNRDKVGELSTELVPHFFKSLSDTLGASVHITMAGDNAHHQVEATFKAVGRALGQALKREGTELPTTKGMI